MREVLSWRFLASILALVVLAGLVAVAAPRQQSSFIAVTNGSSGERHIDLIEPVYLTTAQAGFAMKDGKTTKAMELILDGQRRVYIAPGTPGVVTCTKLSDPARCWVAVDLLGQAVMWFSLIEAPYRATVTLPAITELRRDNDVLLANGWVLKRESVVQRLCDFETESLGDFMSRFGSRSTTTFNRQSQTITKVTCTGEAAPDVTEPPESIPASVPEAPPGSAVPTTGSVVPSTDTAGTEGTTVETLPAVPANTVAATSPPA